MSDPDLGRVRMAVAAATDATAPIVASPAPKPERNPAKCTNIENERSEKKLAIQARANLGVMMERICQSLVTGRSSLVHGVRIRITAKPSGAVDADVGVV